MSKSVTLFAILEKVAATLDFQMFTYLDLTKPSKYLLLPVILLLLHL